MNHRLSQSITGTVTASASVEVRSIEAASDSTALYFAAKSTTTVANGKLQQTSASRANGLTTCRTSSRTKSTAPCSVTRPSEPIRTVGEMRTGCAASTRPTAKTATPDVADPISSKQPAKIAGK